MRISFSQRRNLDRMTDQKTRLNHFLTNSLFINCIYQSTFAVRFIIFNSQLVGFFSQIFDCHFRTQIYSGFFLKLRKIIHSRPFSTPINFRSLPKRNHFFAQNRPSQIFIHFLHFFHPRFQVGIGPIKFHMIKFLQVLPRNPLIPKHSTDLKNFFIPPYQKSLEMQLQRNTQIKVPIQSIIVSDKGLRFRSAGNTLQNRGLNFQKAFLG